MWFGIILSFEQYFSQVSVLKSRFMNGKFNSVAFMTKLMIYSQIWLFQMWFLFLFLAINLVLILIQIGSFLKISKSCAKLIPCCTKRIHWNRFSTGFSDAQLGGFFVGPVRRRWRVWWRWQPVRAVSRADQRRPGGRLVVGLLFARIGRRQRPFRVVLVLVRQ